MKPTRPQMQKWFKDLSAGDRAIVNQAELDLLNVVRPLLLSKGVIDNTTTEQEILETLRMRF